MPSWFPKLDRRLAMGGLVLVASAAMLAVGLISVFSALSGDDPGLPEGSLEEILADDLAPGDAPLEEPAGPPPPPPVRIVIPSLYVDAPILTMGVAGDGYPEVPNRPDQVAWYDFSTPPSRFGNAVFSGHVDWQARTGAGIQGVFYKLRQMEIGDLISVILEDGTEPQYRVIGNVATRYDDPNVVKAMGTTAREVVTLITCGGHWIYDGSTIWGGNYSHRVIVRAERVSAYAGEPGLPDG
jgi:hypothetical protein